MRVAALLAVGIFALTACGQEVSEDSLKDKVAPISVTLNDGQKVECVVYSSYRKGGLWCQPSEVGE